MNGIRPPSGIAGATNLLQTQCASSVMPPLSAAESSTAVGGRAWPIPGGGSVHVGDGELIAGVVRGDEDAFRQLYRRHTPHVLPLVLRMLDGREEDADDVIQETWIAATRSLTGFRGDASFRTWLTGIAINRCRAVLRGRGRWTPLDSIADEPVTRPRPMGERIDLERAIAAIAPGYRAVLMLHDVEGYTHEEIGRMLEVSPGTSKAQLHHARRALRALLEPTMERKDDAGSR
jgi:RNA polymerase sigma factor (sigma-70 family)